MLVASVTYAVVIVTGLLQTSVPANPAKKIAPRCTVAGRVVTAAEGTPLKSARVVLMPEQRDELRTSDVYAATTDADGRFNIKEVPSGRYRFFATHAGYVDQRYKSSGPDTEGAILSLQPGQEINDALFRMVLAAVITGRISDEDGEPMPNMQVVALQRPSEDEREENPWIGKQEVKPIASVQTDDRGQYRLFGLKAGEYYVRAVDEMAPSFIGGFEQDSVAARDSLGSQYAPVYYPGVTQLGQAQTVPLTAGEEAQVDFVIRRMKMVDVSGRVIAADGKPCTNAFVILEEAQGASEMGHVQRTDNKGEFKLRGVPPGSYILTAQVDEGGDIPRFNARQKIEVGGENIEAVALFLGRGSTITGQVTANGRGPMNFERLYVYLSSADADAQPGGYARVKKDGTFTILDVPEGSFSVEVGALERGWHVNYVRAGGEDVLASGLQVEKGRAAAPLQVVISNAGAQVEGSVTLDDKPLVGVRVRLTPEPQTPYNRMQQKTTTTDQSGRFLFTAVAPGQYRLAAKPAGVEGAKAAVSEPKTLTLAEHDRKTVDLAVIQPQAQ